MTARALLQVSGAVIDLVYRVKQLPRPGEEATVSATAIAVGGGFNPMIAARRAGMSVAYGGPHGTGPFGDMLRNALEDAEIPALQPPLEGIDQGSSVVLVDSRGERTFISQTGAEGVVKAEAMALLDRSDFGWTLLSGYTLSYPRAQAAIQQWLERLPDRTCLVFDPGPMVDRIGKPLLETALARAAWVSANAQEAASLTGTAQPGEAATLLAARGTGPGGAVVRCGAQGAWVAASGQPARQVSGFAVPTIDTNGAGDTHVGAFIAAMARGDETIEAVAFANAAAALSTTAFGPATAPMLTEIESFLEQAQGNRMPRQGHKVKTGLS